MSDINASRFSVIRQQARHWRDFRRQGILRFSFKIALQWGLAVGGLVLVVQYLANGDGVNWLFLVPLTLAMFVAGGFFLGLFFWFLAAAINPIARHKRQRKRSI